MAKLSADHVNQIAAILYHWAPDEARVATNGYGGYAITIYGMLRNGLDVHRIAWRLGRMRTLEMGLPPDLDSDQVTAQQLVAWWARQ